MKKIQKDFDKISLNINKDEFEINDFLICWNKFGKRPNKLSVHNTYFTGTVTELIQSYVISKTISTEIAPNSNGELIINQEVFSEINENIFISYFILDKNNPNSITTEVSFFYKEESDYGLIREIVEQMNECILELKTDESHKLNNIIISNSTIEIEPIEFIDNLESFNHYYNTTTYKHLKKMIKNLKKNEKGLYILEGEVGTGKTTSIKFIAKEVHKNFFHIPGNLLESTINNPDFRNFIKKYDSPVFIIDDCESSMIDLLGKNNQTSSNLIQLVDGIHSDTNPVSIICIFNQILDPENHLLECVNLISIVDFEPLSKDEANKLCNILGETKKYKNKTKLIDIIKSKNTTRYKKIGF